MEEAGRGRRQEDLCEFKSSLDYIVNSRMVRAMKRDPVSETKTNNPYLKPNQTKVQPGVVAHICHSWHSWGGCRRVRSSRPPSTT